MFWNRSEQLVLGSAIGFVLLILSPQGVYPHDGENHVNKSQAKVAPELLVRSSQQKDREYFSDLEVLNQEGENLLFYSDMLQDRIVLINFVYTNCRDTCPIMTSKLVRVKQLLGEPTERAVHFISISTDPERDTPAALKEFAEKNKATSKNWTFLTGEKKNIDHIIGRFGQYNEDFGAHSTLMLIGNLKTRHWSKIPPMSTPQMIAGKLESLVEES